MAGYYGTEQQQRLQKRVDALTEWMRTAPGASNAGRLISTDDPDAFGRARLLGMLNELDVFGFRTIPVDQIAEVEDWLADHGFRFDWWDVFTAERETALHAVRPVLDAGLPEGIDVTNLDCGPEAETVVAVQAFMAAHGVAPFSGSMLVGESTPALTVALVRKGAILATGHAAMPYSIRSRNHRAAWCGLIAVSQAERRKGLGRIVNAMVVDAAFRRLEAESVQEFAHASNIGSRRMIEACGLTLDPSVKSGIATRGGERFTT